VWSVIAGSSVLSATAVAYPTPPPG
jgi:hypothetical protein